MIHQWKIRPSCHTATGINKLSKSGEELEELDLDPIVESRRPARFHRHSILSSRRFFNYFVMEQKWETASSVCLRLSYDLLFFSIFVFPEINIRTEIVHYLNIHRALSSFEDANGNFNEHLASQLQSNISETFPSIISPRFFFQVHYESCEL